jgi:hypothetical protein
MQPAAIAAHIGHRPQIQKAAMSAADSIANTGSVSAKDLASFQSAFDKALGNTGSLTNAAHMPMSRLQWHNRPAQADGDQNQLPPAAEAARAMRAYGQSV